MDVMRGVLRAHKVSSDTPGAAGASGDRIRQSGGCKQTHYDPNFVTHGLSVTPGR